jgi:hypothetical protein
MIALDGSTTASARCHSSGDVPAFPFIAIGSGNGATGRHRTLDGRCFFPAPTTNICIPLMLTALRLRRTSLGIDQKG